MRDRIIQKVLIIVFLINTGILLMSGESLHWNKGRGYSPFRYATSEGILIDNNTDTLQYDYFGLTSPCSDFQIKFRAANLNGHPSRKYTYYNSRGQQVGVNNPHWGFFIKCERVVLTFTVKGTEKFTALEPVPALEITLHNLSNSFSESVTLTDKINPYEGDNLWNLQVKDGKLKLSAGDKDLLPIINYTCKSDIEGFGFFAGWGDKLSIKDISVEFDGGGVTDLYPIDTLRFYLSNSEDPMEGFWTLFDRELEENLIKMGGIYNLACVKEGEKYVLLYLDGATVNSQGWKPGDIKAILTPTPFSDIFDVDWVDSMKQHLDKDVRAQLGTGNTMIFQFPYQSSKLRLRKISE